MKGTGLGGGHPSIHVTPAALAVGEEQGSSGKRVLESIIVGYEITSRIGGATTAKHEIHSHGTWGTIGSAVATARLLGFDAAQTRQTINLAASMSPANTWTPCFEGATVRNLYPGRSNFQGILAAHLSQCGFTGLKDGDRLTCTPLSWERGLTLNWRWMAWVKPGVTASSKTILSFTPVAGTTIRFWMRCKACSGKMSSRRRKSNKSRWRAPAMALTMTNPGSPIICCRPSSRFPTPWLPPSFRG